MIGSPVKQLNLADSAFSNRKKRSRTEKQLDEINAFIDWSKLVKKVEKTYKKSKRGRPSIPIIYMLKILILQRLYDLSDPEMEDALIDRLSFQRFVGFSFSEEVPDFSTIWRFRERLVKAELIDELFDEVLQMIEQTGHRLVRGKMTLVDATIVPASRKAPKEDEPQSPQKDADARATKKGNKGYFGYKGHVGVNQETGIVHSARFTAANVHDSQEFDALLTGQEQAVFADKAYDSADRKRHFRRQGIYYGIMEKAHRNRPLSKAQKTLNRHKSRIRCQVERVFAQLKRWYGYTRVRYVNHGRNKLQFLLLCMIYNIRRALTLVAA
ncbi:MAG: IS5 family transposase [candidate division KSB1 bacterium]|nr:IS5 family transposase [candidate division KSB1 bacterium]